MNKFLQYQDHNTTPQIIYLTQLINIATHVIHWQLLTAKSPTLSNKSTAKFSKKQQAFISESQTLSFNDQITTSPSLSLSALPTALFSSQVGSLSQQFSGGIYTPICLLMLHNSGVIGFSSQGSMLQSGVILVCFASQFVSSGVSRGYLLFHYVIVLVVIT